MNVENIENRKAALALNLCTVSVSQIIDYEDINILKQEYDAILNNINLQEIIKDESLLNAIKSILDTLTFYMIQDEEKKIVEKEYEQNLKNALLSAFRPTGMLFVSGSPITMAVAAVTMVGTGYLNYRSAKVQAKLAHEKELWKLRRSAIEQLHGLRKSLFETAWRLSDTYQFPDEWRLTEKQITRYNTILMEPDPHKRYDRLDVLSSTFGAFPSFWYYKGRAALEAADKYQDNTAVSAKFKELARAAYDEYDKVYLPLMREDIIASQAALDKISMLDRTQDKDKIIQLLERAEKMAGENYDVLQLCAINYLNIAEPQSAIKILRVLINENYNLYLNGRLLSRIYREQDQRADFELLSLRVGERNILPWTEKLDDGFAQAEKDERTRIGNRAKKLIPKYFELASDSIIKPLEQKMVQWQQEPRIRKRIAISSDLKMWAKEVKSPVNDMINAFVTSTRYMPIWNYISDNTGNLPSTGMDATRFQQIRRENSCSIDELSKKFHMFAKLGKDLGATMHFWTSDTASGQEGTALSKAADAGAKSVLRGFSKVTNMVGATSLSQAAESAASAVDQETPEEKKYIEFGDYLTGSITEIRKSLAELASRYPLHLVESFCSGEEIPAQVFDDACHALELLENDIHQMEDERNDGNQAETELKTKWYFVLDRKNETEQNRDDE